jgi:hypothetical protein
VKEIIPVQMKFLGDHRHQKEQWDWLSKREKTVSIKR